MKEVLRGKFIALGAFMKTLEKCNTSKLASFLRSQVQKDTNTPKRIKRKEIVKLRPEINQLESKRTREREK